MFVSELRVSGQINRVLSTFLREHSQDSAFLFFSVSVFTEVVYWLMAKLLGFPIQLIMCTDLLAILILVSEERDGVTLSNGFLFLGIIVHFKGSKSHRVSVCHKKMMNWLLFAACNCVLGYLLRLVETFSIRSQCQQWVFPTTNRVFHRLDTDRWATKIFGQARRCQKIARLVDSKKRG